MIKERISNKLTKYLIRPSVICVTYFLFTIIFGYLFLDFSLENLTVKIEFSKFESNFINKNLEKSFLLYSTSFVCFFAGILLLPKQFSKIIKPISDIVNEKKLTTRSLIIVIFYGLLGSTGIIYTLVKVGVVPLFNPDPLSAKHFLKITDKFLPYRPLYMFSYMFLVISSTILIYFFIIKTSYKKRLFIALLIFFQLFILLLTMKRALVLSPFFSICIAYVLVGRSGIKGLLISFLCIIIIGTSMEYIGKPKVPLEKVPLEKVPLEKVPLEKVELILQDFIQRMSNNFFVEPRELARVLIAWESKKINFLYGKSYLASFLGFIPSSQTDFKSKYNIGRFTLLILGYNPASGAIPRIGYVGEAYLNFGWAGVIFVSFIFGFIIRLIDNIYIALRYRTQPTLWGMLVLWLVLIEPSLGFFGAGSSEFAFAGFTVLLLLPLILDKKEGRNEK